MKNGEYKLAWQTLLIGVTVIALSWLVIGVMPVDLPWLWGFATYGQSTGSGSA